MIKLNTTTAYNVQEASELLHISDQTVRKYIRDGKIKAQKVGVKYYVTNKTIENFLKGNAGQ